MAIWTRQLKTSEPVNIVSGGFLVDGLLSETDGFLNAQESDGWIKIPKEYEDD